MSTSLFGSIIFGPVHSRRLGLSLGVNLLPPDGKLCNFDCVYCECGWNAERISKNKFNKTEDVLSALESKLLEMKAEGKMPDVITFAGNGEPTMHPHFAKIIDMTIELRDKLSPKSKVAVLSNATMISREEVRQALLKVDDNILKLDSVLDATVKLINNPKGSYQVKNIIEYLKSFSGKLIVQTMLLRGEVSETHIDNTTDEEITPYIEAIKEITPQQVMLYSIDRDTPLQTLEKISIEEMEKIAEKIRKIGIKCSVF